MCLVQVVVIVEFYVIFTCLMGGFLCMENTVP